MGAGLSLSALTVRRCVLTIRRSCSGRDYAPHRLDCWQDGVGCPVRRTTSPRCQVRRWRWRQGRGVSAISGPGGRPSPGLSCGMPAGTGALEAIRESFVVLLPLKDPPFLLAISPSIWLPSSVMPLVLPLTTTARLARLLSRIWLSLIVTLLTGPAPDQIITCP
jgi:hypothetical protein